MIAIINVILINFNMRDRDLKVEGKLQLCLIIKCRYSKGHLIKFQIKETNHSIIHLILTVL